MKFSNYYLQKTTHQYRLFQTIDVQLFAELKALRFYQEPID